MKNYRIYGASDDLIEVDGDLREEYNADKGTFTLAAPDGAGVRIHVKYESTGTWRVGLHALDEDQDINDWRFVVLPSGDPARGEPAYSAVLVATAPDEAVLSWDGDA